MVLNIRGQLLTNTYFRSTFIILVVVMLAESDPIRAFRFITQLHSLLTESRIPMQDASRTQIHSVTASKSRDFATPKRQRVDTCSDESERHLRVISRRRENSVGAGVSKEPARCVHQMRSTELFTQSATIMCANEPNKLFRIPAVHCASSSMRPGNR